MSSRNGTSPSQSSERTEITSTGIVRKRNENGYIIHPDRHDTGGFDRRLGWSFIIAGVLTSAIALPKYGLRGVIAPLLAFGTIGVVYARSGRQKRRRVGGCRGKHRSGDRDDSGSTLLDLDPIWPYRYYWALLGFGSIGATVVTGGGLLGQIVPVVTFIAIVVLVANSIRATRGENGKSRES